MRCFFNLLLEKDGHKQGLDTYADSSVDLVTGNSGVWPWRPCYAYAWLQAFKPIELRAPFRVDSLLLFFSFFIYY